MREGDEADDVYVISAGELVATTRSAYGDVTVGRIGEGQVVGEVTVIAGGRRTATLTAAGPAEVQVIRRADFEQWLDEHPEMADAVSAQARERIDRTHVAGMVTELLGRATPCWSRRSWTASGGAGSRPATCCSSRVTGRTPRTSSSAAASWSRCDRTTRAAGDGGDGGTCRRTRPWRRRRRTRAARRCATFGDRSCRPRHDTRHVDRRDVRGAGAPVAGAHAARRPWRHLEAADPAPAVGSRRLADRGRHRTARFRRRCSTRSSPRSPGSVRSATSRASGSTGCSTGPASRRRPPTRSGSRGCRS